MPTRERVLHTTGVVLLVVLLLPFIVFLAPQVVGASHSFVVLSSSMSPTIHAGDVVLVAPAAPADITEGDIVTYEPPGESEPATEYVTHRVVEVVVREDGTYLETKGDANEEADRELVPVENVLGRVWITIPKIGHVIQFAGTREGILAFVVAPAVLLMGSEAWTLLAAARVSRAGDEPTPDSLDEHTNDDPSDRVD